MKKKQKIDISKIQCFEVLSSLYQLGRVFTYQDKNIGLSILRELFCKKLFKVVCSL